MGYATHKGGMRRITSLPQVISATHIQRKKYELDSEGKLTSVPEYTIKVKFRRFDNNVLEREFVCKAHPDTLEHSDYMAIIQNIIKDGDKSN